MKFTWIIKILDVIHDVLCPFFRDKKETKEETKEEVKKDK